LAFLKLKTKAGNYPYVTARVRAKKESLLPREEYSKLLVRDASEIARALQERTYKAEIDELAAKYRGAELVERATRLHLGNVYEQIHGFATGELAVIIGEYLGRYDVYNVKTVLRGIFSRSTAEHILEDTIPAGNLRHRLPELARMTSLEDVARALTGTPYGSVILPLVEGRTLTNLVELENALDHAYYAHLVAFMPNQTREHKAMQQWLQNEIDVINLQNLFRLRFAGITEWEEYFLDGGRQVKRQMAQRIVRGSDEEVLADVGELSVATEVVDATRKALAERDVNPVVTALARELVRDASDFSRRAPLSVLPVIDFILSKKVEADNLRAIAYGKQTGLDSETIEGLLIL